MKHEILKFCHRLCKTQALVLPFLYICTTKDFKPKLWNWIVTNKLVFSLLKYREFKFTYKI